MNDSSPSLPESDPAPPVPASISSEHTDRSGTDESMDMSHLPAEHRDTLQRLHRRVQDAVETIERLRAKNRELQQRVEELEARPTFPENDTVVALDDDPDELRAQITDFIDAIDTFLETTPTDDDPKAADDDPSAPPSDDSPDA